MNNEEYHSSPEISKSDLDAAAKSGVHFLHKKEGPKSKPTPAMRIGSAFHALILEPDVFENEFIYKPEILNARSKDGKEWKARQEEAGKTVLNEDDKEQLEEINEALISGTLATLGLIGTKLLGGAKAAAVAGKGILSAGKAVAAKGMGAAKTAFSGAKNVAQTGMSKATKALGKVSNIAKEKTKGMGDTMKDIGKSVGDDVKDEMKRKILQGDDGGSNKITKTGQLTAPTANINSSADLFDIVKGQLLDEGLSEEEIKDIMLTLTPDEIMNEMAVNPNIAAMDAKNKADMIARAKAKEVPQNIRDASKRQMKAGTPREDPKNPYTTQDKKDIINYNKDK